MTREIKYKVYFDDETDKELEDIQLECEKVELKLEKLAERLEKIADDMYNADEHFGKEWYSKLNSKSYDLCGSGVSSWIKNFRINPHHSD